MTSHVLLLLTKRLSFEVICIDDLLMRTWGCNIVYSWNCFSFNLNATKGHTEFWGKLAELYCTVVICSCHSRLHKSLFQHLINAVNPVSYLGINYPKRN